MRLSNFFHRHQWKIAAALRTVPTIVIAHTFCAFRDTRISYGSCLLIQRYFCVLQNYAEREKAELTKCSWYPRWNLGVTMHSSETIKLQFGKRTPYFIAFYQYCWLIIFVVTPNFVLDFNNTCQDLIFPQIQWTVQTYLSIRASSDEAGWPGLRTFAPKSCYGEIFFISPLELVHKVLTPKMKKKMGVTDFVPEKMAEEKCLNFDKLVIITRCSLLC